MYVIGDVHGKIDSYNRITSGLDYSIQLGDMSFMYGRIDADPAHHKFFGGNHDNYSSIHYSPNWIGGRFGPSSLNGQPFYYVEGAFSIDLAYRLMGYVKGESKSWWPQEELSFSEMNECLKLYGEVKPDILITHTCPTSIEKIVGNPNTLEMYGLGGYISKTNELLQAMLDIHRPSVWTFGHFHMSWTKKIGGTEFICLDELEAVQL